MPIQIIEELKRTMLHFGTGDIHITDARMKDTKQPLVIFHQMEAKPIGSSSPELHGTECDDFAVGMTFTVPESIDAVIDVLREFKAEHFPAQTPNTDTPRTDKLIHKKACGGFYRGNSEKLFEEHARQLERELTAANQRVKEAEDYLADANKLVETFDQLRTDLAAQKELAEKGTATIHRWQKLIADLEQDNERLRGELALAEKCVEALRCFHYSPTCTCHSCTTVAVYDKHKQEQK